MPKPTPEELLIKQKKKTLLVLSNKILSGISFKTVKTFTDAYKLLGRDTIDNRPIVFKEIKAILDDLAAKIDKPTDAPIPDLVERSGASISSSAIEPSTTTEQDINKGLSTRLITVPTQQPVIAATKVEEKPAQKDDIKTYNYGYVKSPNESPKFFPYYFQKKAIVELFDGVVKHNKRGQLLLAGTGLGKTYILGGVIRRLLDIKFTEDKTYGPVHYLYVTKATVVEQTKKVFKKNFNITMNDAVEVLNIEQLRSRAGTMWVEEHMSIVDGEEVYDWKWRKNIQPPVLILDECQVIKNVGSTQSKIIQAYADLPGKNTYTIFMSATPFLRVTESKGFVLNCHMEDKEFSV